MSKKINTSEEILSINETNDKKQDLGSAGKGVVIQTKNGKDLLNSSYSIPYALSENF